MESSMETSVRGGWKCESTISCDYWLCMRFAHTLMEIANEDCAVGASGIWTWISSLINLDCAVEAGRLVEEIWTCDLFTFDTSLCVNFGDSAESCERFVLCIVTCSLSLYYTDSSGFSAIAFPITYCVDMRAWLLFYVCMRLFLFPHIDDQL